MINYRHRKLTSTLALILSLFQLVYPLSSHALPTGYQVEAGEVSFDASQENQLIITASDKAIINFENFSINPNELVQFIQPGIEASVLGRISGGEMSHIWGSLFANGSLFLVNAAGIHVHEGATVDVGSLLASTMEISNAMFAAEQYEFAKVPGSDLGRIMNEGEMHARDGGFIALLGEEVVNRGILEADLGSVGLGVGEKAVLSFDGNGLINLVIEEGLRRQITEREDLILNEGDIYANGGKVVLTAETLEATLNGVINNEGVIEASRAVERDGVVEFISNVANENAGEIHATVLNEEGYTFRNLQNATLDGGIDEFENVIRGDAFYNNLDGAINISGNIGSNQIDNGDIIVVGDVTLTADGLTFVADYDGNGTGKFSMDVGTQITDGGNFYTLNLKAGEDSTLRTFSTFMGLTLDRAPGGSTTPVYTANNNLELQGLTVFANTTLFLNGQGLTLNGGAASPSNNGTIRLRGDEFVNISAGDDNSGTWEYVGDGDGNADSYNLKDFTSSGETYYHLKINMTDTADSVQATNITSVIVNGDLIVASGTFDLDDISTGLTVHGNVLNNATIQLAGSESITLDNGNDTNSGTWKYVGNNNGTPDNFDIKAFGGDDYYNLIIASLDSGANADSFGQSASDIDMNGALTVTVGGMTIGGVNLTVDGLVTVNGGDLAVGGDHLATFSGGFLMSSGTFDAQNDDLDITGNFTQSGSDFTAPGNTYSFTISGNFSHSSGTFGHNNGRVTLDGNDQTISGSTTFYSLQKNVAAARTLTFEAGSTQTITNDITLTGIAGNLLSLRSSSAGSQWSINLPNTSNVDYTDVKDSNNTGIKPTGTTGTVNSGNNLNWFDLRTWTGALDNDFFTAGNWNLVTVPVDGDDVIIADAANDPLLTAAYTAGSLTINSSAILDIAGFALTVNGVIANSGTLRLQGGETVTLANGNDIDSGTWQYWGIDDESGVQYTIKDFGSTDYFHLIVDQVDFTEGDTYKAGSALAIAGNFSVLNYTFYQANGNTTNVTGNTLVDQYSGYVAGAANQSFNGNLTVASEGAFTGGAGNIDVNGNVVFGDLANITVPSGIFTVGGNWTANINTSFSAPADVTFDKASGTQSIASSGTAFGDVTHSGAGTLRLGDASDMDSLSNTAGVFYLNGHDLTISGAESNTATIRLQGTEAVSIGTHDTDSGTWEYIGDGDGSNDTITIYDFGSGADYYHLTLNATDGGNDTFDLSANLDVNGNFTGDGGDFSLGSRNLNLAGNFTWNAQGSGGAFGGGNGTVILDGGNQSINLAEPLTFYNLTKSVSSAATLTISASATPGEKTLTVSNDLILTGASGQLLSLRSSSTGTQWEINPQDFKNIAYVDVKDSNNVNGLAVGAANATNSGNNTNWTFGATYTWTGASSTVWNVAGNWDLGAVPTSLDNAVINNVTNDPILDTHISLADLTLNSSSILDLVGFNLTLSGSLSNDGTVKLQGNQSISGVTQDTNSGTWEYVGRNLAENLLIKDFGSGTDYYNLIINDTNATKATFIPNGSTMNVGGALTISSGTYDMGSSSTTVTGQATVSGGTYLANGNTATFNGGLSVSSGNFTGSSGNVDINGDFNFGGTFMAPNASSAFTVSGNVYPNSGTYSHNSGRITFDGSGEQLFDAAGNSFFKITHSGSGTLKLQSNLAVTSEFNNAAGIFDLDGSDWMMTGAAFLNNGTVQLEGGEAITGLTQDTDSGTWRYAGDGDGSTDIFTIKDFGAAVDYYNLTINGTDTNEIFVLGNTLIVAGALTITSGEYRRAGNTGTITGLTTLNGGLFTVGTPGGTHTFNGGLTVSSGTFSGVGSNLDINGDFSQSGGTVTLPAATHSFNLSGNFSHSGGTFNHNNGMVTLDGTDQSITGSTTFYNLTKNVTTARTLTFEAGSTTTIANSIALAGSMGSPLSLRSSSNGSQWNIDLPGGSFQLDYLDIKDSNNTGEKPTGTTGNVNSGNNTNWFGNTLTWVGGTSTDFGLAANWDLGLAPTSDDDVIIADVSNDPILSGNISLVGLTLNSNSILDLAGFNLTLSGAFSNSGTLQLQGSETVSLTQDTNSGTWKYMGNGNGNNNTFTVKDFGSGTDYYNLIIDSTDHAIGFEDTYQITSALTVANAMTVSNGRYTSNGNDATINSLLTINSSDATYTASTGTQTLNGGIAISNGDFTASSGTVDINGDVTISGGTFTAPAAAGYLLVSGNWSETAGTFMNNSGAITFDKSSGTQTFSGSDGYNRFTHSGAGTLRLTTGETLTLSGILTNSAGVLDLNGGSISSSAPGNNLFNDGSIRLRGSETLSLGAPGNNDTDSGTWEYVGDGDGNADTYTIKDFGSTDYFNLTINSTDANDVFQLGSAAGIAGALTMTSGTMTANGNTNTVTGMVTVNGGTYQSSTATNTFNGGLTLSSGTFTGSSGTVDANGAVNQSGGTFTAPSNLFVSGNYSVTAGTFNHNSGTITLDGTADQTITNGTTLHHIVINNTGAAGNDDVIATADLDIAGNLTVTDGDFDLDVNDPGISIGGNLTIGAAGSWTKGSGTTTFDGTGIDTLDANGQDLGNVTVDGASKTLRLINTSATFSTLTIGADDTFDLNAQNTTITTLSNNNNFRLQGSETITLTNNDINSGTWTYVGNGSGIVDTYTIKDFGAGTDYYNLSISSTHLVDIYQSSANTNVAGAFTVSNGTYSANGNAITVSGLASINGGGATYQSSTATNTFNGGLTLSAGTFTGSTGTVDVNGNFSQTAGTFTGPLNMNVSGSSFNQAGGTFTAPNSLTFDGNSNLTFTTGGQSYSNINLNNSGASGSDRLIVSGNLSIVNLTVSDGDLRLLPNNPNVTTVGSVLIQSGGSVTKGTGTWTIAGSGTNTFDGNGQDFGNVTVDGTSKTLQLINTSATFSTLTIGADDTFDLNGQNTTITTLSNNNIFSLRGSETITLSANDTNSGLWLYKGDGDSAVDNYTIKDFGATDYFNLRINSTDANDVFNLGSNLNVAGAFTISSGEYRYQAHNTTVAGLVTVNGGAFTTGTPGGTQTFNGGLTLSSGVFNGGGTTLDVNGVFTQSGGTFTAPASTMNVSDDFLVSGGTFTHNSGEVILDTTTEATVDAPGGGLSFWDLTVMTAGKTVKFTSGDTFNVLAPTTCTIIGSAGNLITLTSTGAGQFNINPNAWDISFVNISNVNNINGSTINLPDSTDSGNNTGFSFGGGGGGGGGSGGGNEGSGGGGGGLGDQSCQAGCGGSSGSGSGSGSSGNEGGDEGDGDGGESNGSGGENGGKGFGGGFSGGGEKADSDSGKDDAGTDAPKVKTNVFVKEGTVYVIIHGKGKRGLVHDQERVSVNPDGSTSMRMKGIYVSTPEGVRVLRSKVHTPLEFFRFGEKTAGMAQDSKSRKVYALLPETKRVVVIDADQLRTEQNIFGLDEGASAITISPDGKYAYIADGVSDQIQVMDLAKQEVVNTFGTGSMPSYLVMNGKYLYATNRLDGTVSKFDTETGEEVLVMQAGKSPFGMVLSEDGKTLYVADTAGGVVKVLNAQTGDEEGSIEVGDGPHMLEIEPKSGMLLVTNRESGTVSLVDLRSGKEVDKIKVGKRPFGMALSEQTEKQYLYVASEQSGVVDFIDLGKREVAEQIPAGVGAKQVLVSAPEATN